VSGRLYVHDWHEHCDDGTHAKLIGAVQTFANGVVPRIPDRRINADRLKVLAASYLERYGVTIGRECLPATDEPRLPLYPEPPATGGDAVPTECQHVDNVLPTRVTHDDDALPTRDTRVDDALSLVLSTESKFTDPPLKPPPSEPEKRVRRSRSRSPDSEPGEFDLFWDEFEKLYPPRPGGANMALARRKLRTKPAELRPAILDGVRRFRIWADLTGKSGTDEGVCHATTWINQERWLEPYTVPAKGVGDPKTSPPAPRGPIEGVHFVSLPVRDESGALVMRLVVKGSGEVIDRAWVRAWFDVNVGGPDWQAEAERWCEARGLRAEDGFQEDAA
jgi:hypothetical protein